jgi:hypothetical protein
MVPAKSPLAKCLHSLQVAWQFGKRRGEAGAWNTFDLIGHVSTPLRRICYFVIPSRARNLICNMIFPQKVTKETKRLVSGLRQISKQALLLPLMTEAPEALRYLLFKTYRDRWALRYKQKSRFLARLGMTIRPLWVGLTRKCSSVDRGVSRAKLM